MLAPRSCPVGDQIEEEYATRPIDGGIRPSSSVTARRHELSRRRNGLSSRAFRASTSWRIGRARAVKSTRRFYFRPFDVQHDWPNPFPLREPAATVRQSTARLIMAAFERLASAGAWTRTLWTNDRAGRP